MERGETLSMENTLAGFSADRFRIDAPCRSCGHQARLAQGEFAPDLAMHALRRTPRCSVGEARDVGSIIGYCSVGGSDYGPY